MHDEIRSAIRISDHVGNGAFRLTGIDQPERKRATKFREYLRDRGFFMMQFSCYIRFTAGKEQADALAAKVGAKCRMAAKSTSYFLPTRNMADQIVSRRGQDESPCKTRSVTALLTGPGQ